MDNIEDVLLLFLFFASSGRDALNLLTQIDTEALGNLLLMTHHVAGVRLPKLFLQPFEKLFSGLELEFFLLLLLFVDISNRDVKNADLWLR